MASLERFLRTGSLGPIHPGMSQAEAIALLGPPPDESVQGEPNILKYGGLQLTFARSSSSKEPVLVLIGLYFYSSSESLPEVVAITDGDFQSQTSVADVLKLLARLGLEAIEKRDDDDLRLTLASGAQIIFANQKLWSILWATRHSATTKRQVSVSIPDDAWQQLSMLARQSNRSVAELCAQWIAQRANELKPADHAP